MGTSCGITKKNGWNNQISMKSTLDTPSWHSLQHSLKEARIGPYCISQSPDSKESLSTWRKMINSYKTAPKRLRFASSSFLTKLKEGPPPQCRWQAWQSVINSKYQSYESSPMGTSSSLSAIERDLARTFPSERYFDKEKFEGQETLRRILGKISGSHPDIGYCQGMNYICGFLLLISGGKETEVFSVMQSLLKDYNLKGFFKEDMPYLKQCLWVFSKLLKKEYPALAKHLDEKGVLGELWALKWFLTVFTATFKPRLTVRVWDLFLVEKMIALYKVALALVGDFEEELMILDTPELCEFFKVIGDKVRNEERLVEKALLCKVTEGEVKKLEKMYSFNSAISIQLEHQEVCK